MKVYTIEPADFASNSFIVTADDKNCILIDCALPQAVERCQELGLKLCAVLLTHGHFDHIGGCGVAHKNGVAIYCGEGEDGFIFSKANREVFGGVPIPDFKVSGTFADGETRNFCGIEVKAIATPGHTAGGVCYIIEDCLFSGDTLFEGSIGRSDLPGGDTLTLIASVKKLYALNGDYTVYCGHGGRTSLSRERKYNPFVRQ